jgi:ribosomal-protein-alanine N-acetyltransferase
VLAWRRPQPGDEPLYAQLFGDPEVGATLWPGELGGPRSHEQSATFLAHDLEHWERDGFGPWVFHADDVFAGRGGLERTEVGGMPSVEVLYAVTAACWGHGYATAMARLAVEHAAELGLPEVVGFAWTANPASVRVLEKAGLVFDREIEHAGLPHWFGRLQRPS